MRAMDEEGVVARLPERQKKDANPSDLERGKDFVEDEDLGFETVDEEEEEEGTENPEVCFDLFLIPLRFADN